MHMFKTYRLATLAKTFVLFLTLFAASAASAFALDLETARAKGLVGEVDDERLHLEDARLGSRFLSGRCRIRGALGVHPVAAGAAPGEEHEDNGEDGNELRRLLGLRGVGRFGFLGLVRV